MTNLPLDHSRRSIPNRIAHTKARMEMAVALLPTAAALPWQSMTQLLDELAPTATTPGPERAVAFGVTVASDCHSLTWHVVDDREYLLQHVGDNIQRMGAPASRLLPLMQCSLATQDQRIGCWCRGDADGVIAGWSLPVALAWEETRPLLPEHPEAELLVEWAQTLAIPACQSLAQSYLGAASHTALQLPLPGEDTTTKLQHAQLLLDKVEQNFSPIATQTILDHTDVTTPLALLVELSSRGIRRIGINVPHPSSPLLHELHKLVTQDAANEQACSAPSKLAAFQGMLGANALESVRVVQHERGCHNFYTYFPLGFDI